MIWENWKYLIMIGIGFFNISEQKIKREKGKN
jgi:hypothetical protein